MRRSCTFWNSYITVASSPGCTCTERWAGLNCQGPRTLASNSTVIVRLVSTCVLSLTSAPALPPPGTCRSDSDRMLMPVTSQMCL